MRLCVWLLASWAICAAQTITFSPSTDAPSYTVWAVTACGAQDLSAGQIYQDMVANGVTPLLNVQALDLLSQAQKKSFWSKAYTYGTYALAGATALMNLKVVQANPNWVKALNVADGALTTLIPLAQKNVSTTQPSWASLLVRDHDLIRVGTGDCQSVVVLGGRGKPFSVGGK
jgi:hypothetical protein